MPRTVKIEISDEEVLALRRRYAAGQGSVLATELAAERKVSKEWMRRMLLGLTHKHVPEAVEQMFLQGAQRRYEPEVVLFMRLIYHSPVVSTETLASAYGGNAENIGRILKGQVYKDVPEAHVHLKRAVPNAAVLLAAQSARRKFTPEQVIALRAAYDPPRVMAAALARQHKVTVETMTNLISGRSYSEIPGAKPVVRRMSETPDLTEQQVVEARRVYRFRMRGMPRISRSLGISEVQAERMIFGFTHRDIPGALDPITERATPHCHRRRIIPRRRVPIAVRPDHNAARFVTDV